MLLSRFQRFIPITAPQQVSRQAFRRIGHAACRALPCFPTAPLAFAASRHPPGNPAAERPRSAHAGQHAPTTGVVVADTYKMWRDALTTMVNTIRDLQVIGDAATGHEVVGLCRRMKPDIVIISVELDGLNGIEATRRIMRARPETKVILIQTSSDEDTTIRAIRSGALGLVSRNDPATHLVEALGEVKHGRSYVGPQAWRLVLGRVQRQVPARGALRLSPSEIEILKLIAGGRTSREIAAILDVSVQTILGRRQRLMHKLGARNIAGLIVAAVSRGFGIS